MMTNQEIEEALTALALLVNSDVSNTLRLTKGTATMGLAIVQYKARIETLEAKLAEALSRIEVLENYESGITIEEA
ncbi:MAG: hypothetical protein PHN69_04460 [Candidatus Pacebacteria bacterium]|nr:hypothetical protein [Fermentimonas sp.]MDD4804406.1 hypothetical protein [Candidatus Paceibacterota bacterium]